MIKKPKWENANKIMAIQYVYGIHKDIKKYCEDSLVGEYVKHIDEHRQIDYIEKHDKLLIREDDYDKYIFPL